MPTKWACMWLKRPMELALSPKTTKQEAQKAGFFSASERSIPSPGTPPRPPGARSPPFSSPRGARPISAGR